MKNFKKYFEYPDKLRKSVSVVTGIFIAFYSALSGMLIAFIISRFFVDGQPDFTFWKILIYAVTGLPVGILVLLLNVFLTNLISGKTEIERYSYIRLVLLVSIILYFVVLVISILIILVNSGMKFF